MPRCFPMTRPPWRATGGARARAGCILVDLNGAFAGKPKNEEAVKAVVKSLGDDIPVQLGGGIRDLDTIERYLDDGIAYIIIGTAAVKTPGFLHDACYAFPGHIMVGAGCEGRQSGGRWLVQDDRA